VVSPATVAAGQPLSTLSESHPHTAGLRLLLPSTDAATNSYAILFLTLHTGSVHRLVPGPNVSVVHSADGSFIIQNTVEEKISFLIDSVAGPSGRAV